jgi:von Willebrand factor type A domain
LLYGLAMTRVLLLGFVLAATACGGKTFDSLCANTVPPPAACNTACNPAPGAPVACPTGFFCNAGGKCDAQCTATGGQCGDGYSCTASGTCVQNPDKGMDPDVNCPAVHFTATKTTPTIQLLIDRSGSMLEDFNGGAGTPKKFPTEQDALVGATGVVTQLQGSVYFGASMFPSNVCPGLYTSAGGRKLNNQAAITDLLNAHPPDSKANTPTPAAIDAVVADFTANPAPQGSPPVIVLSTDGLPNDCQNNANGAQDATVAAAKNAFAKGIRLFLLVVGNQIDPTFEKTLANAGQGIQTGQPDAKAYTATDPASLSAAFQDIIRGVVSCDLKLSGQIDPGDASTGIVTLDGMDLTFGTDWNLDKDGVTIHLLGRACDTLKMAANPTVDATFACGAVIL